ncbi:hypothetical protein OG864_53695 [Streptomyces sp. NBC_00124]|nr:hypothetical protein [Streptomyces sp. NBC_00140]MCX5367503.1 hypothetical protein [Streptomyces sp. NBC_00124]
MRAGRPTKRWFWRWRSNPLRRRVDVLEAWLVLAVCALITVGGTLAGTVTALAADGVSARQRAARTAVHAVLLTDTPAAAANSYHTRAKVRWTDHDGSVHTGTTLVSSGKNAGADITVWTNIQGALVTAPPSREAAAVEAGLLGAGAALAVTGLVVGAWAGTRWWLDRRRIDEWGSEWDLVGPQWGHKTS